MLFFLPPVLLLYFLVPSIRWKNSILTLSSLGFYAWGEPVYLIVLIFSAFIDYFHGRWAESMRGRPLACLPMISCVTVNLGLLGFFKYAPLLIHSLNQLLGLELIVPQIALPIGISFYTFQTMSYVIDVSRGKVKSLRSWPDFLMYVSLFPQLIAGPIVRYQEVAHDLRLRTHTLTQVAAGLERFAIGLFKKTFFANIAAELVERTMNLPVSELTMLDAWVGAILYGLQIYFDFSGYSDMAIGLGLIFGFRYPENFRHPYIAKTVQEFWRRWHITLGQFFRDYLYLPLGGRQRFWVRNLLIVWFLTGLWHGASWNFVVWGLYFGWFMLLEGLFLKQTLERLPGIIGHIYLLCVVIVGWVLFYFEDMSRASDYIQVMFTGGRETSVSVSLSILIDYFWWFIAACLACIPVRSWLTQRLLMHANKQRWIINVFAPTFTLTLWLLSLAMLSTTTFNPFIYFRF